VLPSSSQSSARPHTAATTAASTGTGEDGGSTAKSGQRLHRPCAARHLPSHPMMPHMPSALGNGAQTQAPHQTATVVAVGAYAQAYAQLQGLNLPTLPSASLGEPLSSMTGALPPTGTVHGGTFFQQPPPEPQPQPPSPSQQLPPQQLPSQLPPPPQQQQLATPDAAPTAPIAAGPVIVPPPSPTSQRASSQQAPWDLKAVASLVTAGAPPSASEAAALRAQLLKIGVLPCV